MSSIDRGEAEPKQEPTEPLDRTEKLLRVSFEEFLDIRRRAVAPKPGDPPVSLDALASTALLLLKLLVEHGVDWTFMISKSLKKVRTQASDPTLEPDVTFERAHLASVIIEGGVVPPEFQHRLFSGLRALNQGEVQPLLAPAQLGRWRTPYGLAELRMHALFHVHLMWGRGLKKGAATQQVAEAFGISSANVRKWEQTWIPEIMGSIDLSLGTAKKAGRLARQFPGGIPEQYRSWSWFLNYLEQERPLVALAEEHRQLMRQPSPKSRERKNLLRTDPE